MRDIRLHRILAFPTIVLILLLGSCTDDSSDDEMMNNVNFDRSAMLQFWANDIIVPSYESYGDALNELVVAKNAFISSCDINDFDTLRDSWLVAYRRWQRVAMFEIGKAEEINYRNFVNIYPTDTEEIESFITSGNFNLTLPSTFDAQGFPALDYLLYGLGGTSTEQSSTLCQSEYADYLSTLVDRLQALHTEVLTDWTTNFRDSFIDNDGSSATASTDKMVNDFLFYYESVFRAGKVGIPSGVFSASTLSNTVEARYSGIYSRDLFIEAFDAVQKFFNGESAISNTTGTSLRQYLEQVSIALETENIAPIINQQWESVNTALTEVEDNFSNQIEVDNSKMRALYDEIQKAVPPLKVDMTSALNIQIDFVDADGD